MKEINNGNRRNRKLNGSAAIINESGSLANVAAAETAERK
jgi:hypothetical protein